jgi:hypothetical protein
VIAARQQSQLLSKTEDLLGEAKLFRRQSGFGRFQLGYELL